MTPSRASTEDHHHHRLLCRVHHHHHHHHGVPGAHGAPRPPPPRGSPPGVSSISIDFTKTGLRQIPSSQACPDHQTFTLQATGKVSIGTYCRTGPIGEVQVLNQGTFSLHVPTKEPLHPARFNVSVGTEIKSLAKLQVVLPAGGKSPVELLSPNFPQSFPDDDLVEWDVRVPPQHRATVQVVNHTQPACRKKETGVEYHSSGTSTLLLGLAEPQPARTLQNFTMTLKNCEMDRARGNPHGLSAHFRVSSAPTGVRDGVGSAATETVVVTTLAQLSFQDCSPGDVLITASRVIECRQLKDCSKKPVPLTVPTLPACLPGPLSRVTWTLTPPAQGSGELLCPANGLKQSLPGQLCNGSVVLSVAEDDGRTSLGRFCSRGPLQSIQFRTNVSITASGEQGGVPPTTPLTVLRAHFKEEISEKYIFTVSPKGSLPTLLASPGWPAGMEPYSTVSWIVKVPAKQEALLTFANLSQPKCSNRHANIRVQLLGSPEELYSRREDEEVDHRVVATRSFYLNMSNCMPETGQFSVLTEMTLRKSRNLLLTVIVSVVAGLLVLSALVLAVVCVVVRKKKREMNRNRVSIYNPAGTTFLPGQTHLPGSEEDEYHVYASIEDTLVYTHLLKKLEKQEDDDQVDTYRPFTGPRDPHRPPSATNPEVGTYQPFVGAPPVPQTNQPSSRDMVDNELYDPDGQSDLGTTEDHTPGTSPLGTRMDPEGGD
ncbi:hypothetical protein CRUP_000268 [Coryphaenoides rupestris]|nr:hypothetical protein CRUP_000268 [Coryphaenoides rupestris]